LASGSINTGCRDLFPRECYDEYHYNIENGVVDYNEFAKGNSNELAKDYQRKVPQLRVMKRGRIAKVDAFLDALVCANGIFRFFLIDSNPCTAGKWCLRCA
jgi:hypothetical protein